MTNTNIIANALKARGMTDDQLQQLVTAYNGDLPFHTIPEWSRRGYHVKADEVPVFECDLWKHTSKPSRAAIKAAEDEGKDAPETSPHFYKKLSYIYSSAQVEKNAPAPDLETIKNHLQNLSGLTLTVKGAQTASPVVWLTGNTETHADAIKAVGGIWSKKKSAYWIKPGTAAETAPAEDKPAAPVQDEAPAASALMLEANTLTTEPAPKTETLTIHPGKPCPQPWKKCSFYTIRQDKGDNGPTAHKVNGHTDGIYNYYSIGGNSKVWHAIHQVFGMAVATADTRKAAQEMAMERAEMVRRFEDKPDDGMKRYAAMIKDANDGGNLSLF